MSLAFSCFTLTGPPSGGFQGLPASYQVGRALGRSRWRATNRRPAPVKPARLGQLTYDIQLV
ncbi:MAG: hypothetical protein O3C67_09380, partial [Cyanobacteria bacterium]|nr:hypothetical protein [Cyanobacteriota bacterium]